MGKNRFGKKATALVLVGVCGMTMGLTALPVPFAEASLGSVLGTVVQDALSYKEVEEAIHYYNNTEPGRQALLQSFKKKLKVSENGYLHNRVDNIVSRLSSSIALSDPSINKKPYIYFVNQEKSFNAFCSMGHVMSVNEGLFTMTDNEDELAAVIAHEMGHGQKDHVAKSIRKKMVIEMGAGVLSSAMGASTFSNFALDLAVNQIDNVVIGKKDEWQADNLAFDYLLGAGYNPGATAALWQRVEDKYGASKSSFVGEIFSPSDHPTHKQRKENYMKRVSALGNNRVTAAGGTVKVNGKSFVTPVRAEDMSGAERSYFVQGNLAAAYHNGHSAQSAYVSGNTVMLGAQPIMTCYAGDTSAYELAERLNAIK